MKTDEEILLQFETIIGEKVTDYMVPGNVVYQATAKEVIAFARALAATAPESAPADAPDPQSSLERFRHHNDLLMLPYANWEEFEQLATLNRVQGTADEFLRLGFRAGFACPRRAPSQSAPCSHRIVDGRNPIITSGYLCIDCGAVFAAADHDGKRIPSQSADQVRDAALEEAAMACFNRAENFQTSMLNASKPSDAYTLAHILRSEADSCMSAIRALKSLATSSAAKGEKP